MYIFECFFPVGTNYEVMSIEYITWVAHHRYIMTHNSHPISILQYYKFAIKINLSLHVTSITSTIIKYNKYLILEN